MSETNEVKFQPIHGQIMIKVDEAEEKTAGGIFIPDAAKEKPLTGKVVAVAKGRFIGKHFIPLSVEAGMRIMVMSKYAGNEVELHGQKYKMVHEDHVLGIVTE